MTGSREDFSTREDAVNDVLPVRKIKRKRLVRICTLAGFFFAFLFGAGLFFHTRSARQEEVRALPDAAALLVSSAKEELFFPDGGLPALFGCSSAVTLNGGRPLFTGQELGAAGAQGSFAWYSPLDSLGRCGPACALLDRSMMPEAEHESIGMIRPSGWHTVKYSFIDGLFLYNRCHLIGYQLAGENANPRNLITGTRQLNIDPAAGMLPFENRTASCLRQSSLHVLYRVVPWFYGDEPLPRGVTIEAMSLEDGGERLSFFVYLPNCQAGVDIDYATGESALSPAAAETEGGQA